MAASMKSRSDLLVALQRFGLDSLSFTAVESSMLHWVDGETGAYVAYVDTGSAWVAVGSPLTSRALQKKAARNFVRAASDQSRRACFFGVQAPESRDLTSLLIGEQPVIRPAEWLVTQNRSLREQLRRAIAKGVRVRRVDPADLREGSALHCEVERCAAEWLAARHMEPMSFVVALELFHQPHEHRYFVAEVDGSIVEFLSAVPIYRRDGWLVEDVIRTREAPNGTSELLLDALVRDVASSRMVTLGLSPLTSHVVWPLRLARAATRPLFDFEGLHAFRRRLHPTAWEPVYLTHPRDQSRWLHLLKVLRAFASGSLLRFGVRSLVRHPSGPPWLLALPLLPWCLMLGAIVLFRRASLLGLSSAQLAAWIVFDSILAIALYRVALRPRLFSLGFVAFAAAIDAALSIHHGLAVGLGTGMEMVLRVAATVAPCCGTAVLVWACVRSVTALPSGHRDVIIGKL
jgi:phosphatidylglycerol lysyltransferase